MSDTPSAGKILCVDDDPNILAAYGRSLRKQFTIETAPGPEAGLRMIAESGPYAVVVSDMNMPGMDGIQFLARARERAPDTVRMMLTGNADLRTAMQALHEGAIFQFLVKPCPPESMALALDAGLKQHALLTAEKDLLEKTLQGSIRVLVEILSMVDPESFGRAQGVRREMRTLAEHLHLKERWKLELSAMLAPLGLVTIPTTVLRRLRSGSELADTEQYMLNRVPQISHNLLVNIPRLEEVARTILYSAKHFDGTGFPADGVAGKDIPIGARMLKVLTDLADAEGRGLSRAGALSLMQRSAGRYDPRILEAAGGLSAATSGPAGPRTPCVAVPVHALRVGHTLAADVTRPDGALLISAGHKVTETLLERIRNLMALGGVQEPLQIEREG